MTTNNLHFHSDEEKMDSPRMIIPDQPQVHYVRADRTKKFTSKTILYGAMIAVSIVLCLFLYLSRSPKNGEIPLIKAENGPIKLRPQEQEQTILHSEKTIYGELAPQEQPQKIENLLAEPEKPQAQSPSLPDEFMKTIGEGEENISETKASEEIPSTDVQAINQKEDNGAREKAPKDMEVSEIKVKSSKIATVKPNNEPSAVTEEFYRVQIYSAASQKNAEQQWNKLKGQASSLLSSYSPVIQRVDLGANIGIRYRLQVGRFSKKAAQSFCTSLKKKGIDCWTVRQ